MELLMVWVGSTAGICYGWYRAIQWAIRVDREGARVRTVIDELELEFARDVDDEMLGRRAS